MASHAASMSGSSMRCFVVMGFGVKTDYATGRTLNLDKSYRLLIKPVVEEKGLICVRADELRHSGTIDVPMYQELLTADVVIADLSTANPNALYELGVRHALRPRTTIVISENKLLYPFDLNHVMITSYTHLGEAIDYDEVMRFRQVLGDTLDSVLQDQKTDSPVYTLLHRLTPPALVGHAAQAVAQAGQSLEQAGQVIAEAATNMRTSASALNDAMELLAPLDPEDSNDPETVGLAGAIEKRLFDKGQGEDHLDRAIWYYGRGYYLRNDWYNGVNLAYLLNVRTDTLLDVTKEEQIADLVWANRLRRAVLGLCERELREIRVREGQMGMKADQLKAEQQARDGEQQFWCLATKAEAHFGLGELEAYEKTRAEAQALEHADWMIATFDAQIGRLQTLLGRHGHLLNPPWPGGMTGGFPSA